MAFYQLLRRYDTRSLNGGFDGIVLAIGKLLYIFTYRCMRVPVVDAGVGAQKP